jgi:hypothetical protein
MVPGSENVVDSAALCRASCSAVPRCSAWVWCWRDDGCDDGRDWDPRGRPFGSCALYALPLGRPLAESERGPQFSSFSQGFLTGATTALQPVVRLRMPCIGEFLRRLWPVVPVQTVSPVIL